MAEHTPIPDNEFLRGSNLGRMCAGNLLAELVAALQEAVAQYGTPGGPWNVPSDPGGWLGRARAVLAKATPTCQCPRDNAERGRSC